MELWQVDIETAIAIYDLALAHGKKPGENIQEEFLEILSKNKDKIKLLGETDKDIDLLTGDLRDNGVKILNIHEVDRQKKLKGE